MQLAAEAQGPWTRLRGPRNVTTCACRYCSPDMRVTSCQAPSMIFPHSHTPALPHSHTPTPPHTHTPTLPSSQKFAIFHSPLNFALPTPRYFCETSQLAPWLQHWTLHSTTRRKTRCARFLLLIHVTLARTRVELRGIPLLQEALPRPAKRERST